MNFNEGQPSRLRNKPKRGDALDKFWNFLELLGIRLDSVVSKYCQFKNKKAVACCVFLVMTCMWSMVLIAWRLFTEKPLPYYFIPNFLTDAVAIMMHLSLIKQSKNLATLKKLTRHLSERSKIKSNYFFVLILIAAYFVKNTVAAFAWPIFSERIRNQYPGHFRLEDDRVEYFVCVVNLYLYSIVAYFLHHVLCIIYCIVCHRWAKIISVLRKNVQDAFSRHDSAEADVWGRLFQRYLMVCRGVEVIREAFSAFLFFWVFKQCFFIFASTCLTMIYKDVGIYMNVDTKSNFFLANACFVAIAFYASKVPDEMEKLRKCFVRIRELRALESHLNIGRGVLDRRIDLLARKMITPLTVGGIADLNINFIFLVYSNIITFGLILISIYPGKL